MTRALNASILLSRFDALNAPFTDANGNVGIGTRTPSAPLNIGDSTTPTGLIPLNALFSTNTSSGQNIVMRKSADSNLGAVIVGSKSRGTAAAPTAVQAGDIVGTWRADAYAGANYRTVAAVVATVESYVSDTSISGYLTFSTNTASTSASEKMRLDAAGNLGLGVTPSAWGSTWKSMEFGKAGQTIAGFTGADPLFRMGTNLYTNNGGTDVYAASSKPATQYLQYLGAHQWYTAPSGTAGNAISFTQAMTLDASGNLGIGTSSPASRLTLSGTGTGAWLTVNRTDSGTNIIDFTQSGSRLGYVGYIGSDLNILQAVAANIIFNTNNLERARIDSSGNLLVGTTNSSYTADGGFRVIFGASGNTYVASTRSGSTNSDVTLLVRSTGAGADRFYVGMGGTVYATSTTITAISDQRLKENIQDLDVGLDAVMALKPRKFDWKEGKGKNKKGDRGWIAQEFEQVFPDMIDTWRDPAPEGEEPYKAVNADLIPVLVKAIQEQQAIIESLKARLDAANL